MKKTHFITLIVLATIALFTSCIQEEAPNAECDILAVKSSWLEENKEILSGKPIISNTAVKFYVNEMVGEDEVSIETLKLLDPQFEITPGAQIEKLDRIEENGDRGIYLYYRTTSEDGNWSKDYEVSFTKQTFIDTEATFSFEHFETGKYTTWYEEDATGTRLNWWATANAGFQMSGQGKTPADFPTSVDSMGVKGCGVKLTTRSTGSFGKLMKMPIAPGNLFIGEFLTANATKAPLEATRFGLAIAPGKPISLTGYYKYTPGEVFTNKAMEEIPERIDTCAIYSVLYEIDPNNFEPLNGSNVLSNDRIVLVAQLENPGAESEWTEFEIPYQEFGGNIFDRNKLENGEYAITIVASSSKGGEVFEGAVGSTLHIDELKINWDNK